MRLFQATSYAFFSVQIMQFYIYVNNGGELEMF